MCGRFTLKTPVANWLADLFPDWQSNFDPMALQRLNSEPHKARYNIVPSQPIFVVYMQENNTLTIEPMRWGLVPPWADSLAGGYNMSNARSESIADKPSFRSSLIDKRCIILADGYYEWHTLAPKSKIPYWIYTPQERIFGMAGLWAENHKIPNTNEPDKPLRSTTIITTSANADIEVVHDRMPVILYDNEQSLRWLDPGLNKKEFKDQIIEQLKPSELGKLQVRHVSTRVNIAKNDDADLLQPVDD